MVVGLLTSELFIPGAVAEGETHGGQAGRVKQFNIAVSEVEHQDLWQRAGIVGVTVATDEATAHRELTAVGDAIERVEPGLMTRSEFEFVRQARRVVVQNVATVASPR